MRSSATRVVCRVDVNRRVAANAAITSRFPPAHAQSNALDPPLFMRTVGSAPDCPLPIPGVKSILTIFVRPFLHAHISAVRPSLFRASASAAGPPSSNQRPNSRCPYPQANWSAVVPNLSTAKAAGHLPFAHREAALPKSPLAHASSPPTLRSGAFGNLQSLSKISAGGSGPDSTPTSIGPAKRESGGRSGRRS
eukprot:CAMPEP_0180016418 /NCGR_PEP_ID=MMETSP0984-20121128/19292_1 /TAXON_ID=483367 /ORGANISM="non described non described, Strain CCMP 2436" /LENGTH=193 /DNA_ID=CAMNT_0021939343 /DNA_START=417 /DNA_END=996 /DNA_ORIENTATION=-